MGGLPRNQEHSYPTSVAWREREHFQKGSVCVSRIRESRDDEKGQGLPLSSGKELGLGKGGFRERGLPSHPKHRCLDPRRPPPIYSHSALLGEEGVDGDHSAPPNACCPRKFMSGVTSGSSDAHQSVIFRNNGSSPELKQRAFLPACGCFQFL